MSTAEYMSESVRPDRRAGLGLVGLAGIGILGGLAVAVVPVVGESLRPINLAPVNLAMTALAGGGLMLAALGVVLRQADPVHRGAGVIGGVLLVVVSVSFLTTPLAGLILLTLTTMGVFVTLATLYLTGPTEADDAMTEAADAATETEPRPVAEVIRHPAWRRPKPANLPGAVALKQEVCKPDARLTL
ncbi:hypothetical protein [Roseovarius sp.]|uniref:hypothetical protein n=1 Tax=Roseovarius sp. TaxID=1486281 RepID=UPI003BAD20C6